LPLTVESIEQILEENQIDAVLAYNGWTNSIEPCQRSEELAFGKNIMFD
jgi:carbamoyl-phosphate synthase large subunit